MKTRVFVCEKLLRRDSTSVWLLFLSLLIHQSLFGSRKEKISEERKWGRKLSSIIKKKLPFPLSIECISLFYFFAQSTCCGKYRFYRILLWVFWCVLHARVIKRNINAPKQQWCFEKRFQNKYQIKNGKLFNYSLFFYFLMARCNKKCVFCIRTQLSAFEST